MATGKQERPRRWDALAVIADAFPRDPIVVTLGGTTRELAAMRRSASHLYVLDSMGLPPAIGLGLALGLEDSTFEKVVVLEGDGSLLMGFSTLPTIALTRPEKLVLIVLDNAAYSATGNQPTASTVVDFCATAVACGMQAREVEDLDGLRAALDWARATPGPLMIRLHTSVEAAKVPFLLEDPVVLGNAFAEYVARNK
jgi:thiamine pyrophosphate-dependent acetolactate synthase large subunit-like protein